MEDDCLQKRAEFIDSAVKVREAFSFAHPTETLNAVQKYCTTFHGSNLYDLRGSTAEMIYASWRTNVKLAWNLPRNCRNVFLKTTLVPGLVPPEVSLMTKFHKFYHSLIASPSTEVQVLSILSSRDIRSNLGSNLAHLKNETSIEPRDFGTKRIKEELMTNYVRNVPEDYIWRVKYLDKLISARNSAYYLGETQEYDEINTLIHSLVIN